MERNRLTTKDFATTVKKDERIERNERTMNHPDEGRNRESGRTNDRNSENTWTGSAAEDRPHTFSTDVPSLMGAQDEEEFRARWSSIQTSFVDEPRRSVEQADELVAELMQHLARSFSDQRSTLETQWQRSEQVSTEELRGALRRYRAFFDRLLSI
jgi:hypothetical protein